MSIPFRLVALLCLLDAVALLFFNTYFPLNPDGVQPLWDYVIDPITLIVIAVVVALNIRASIPDAPRPLGNASAAGRSVHHVHGLRGNRLPA